MTENWAQVQLSQYDSPRTIIEAKFNHVWSERQNGIHRSVFWTSPATKDSVLDDSGLTLYYHHDGADSYNSLYSVPDELGRPERAWVLVSQGKESKTYFFSVIGRTTQHLQQLKEQLTSKLVPPSKDKDKTYIGLWHLNAGTADRERRAIGSKPWPGIARNYVPKVQKVLSSLSGMKPGDINGRVMLMWGPAGTGKTTMLRAVAHEWRDWASLEYVIDPEAFLHDAGYMTQVLVDDSYEYDADTDSELTAVRWRLLVLEDAGELIKNDARVSTGGALSKLLNMTDGILGEGRNLLLALTTNDDISQLHPAVTRPGRCLVQAEIPAFTRAEAEQWLGPDYSSVFHEIGDRATLAELYHIRNGSGKHVVSTAASREVDSGQYL